MKPDTTQTTAPTRAPAASSAAIRAARIRRCLAIGAVGVLGATVFAIADSGDSEAQRRRRRGKDKVAERVDRRFDHEAHSQMVKNKLGKDEPCAGKCHKMSDDLKGWKLEFDDKKEHERCYETCHGGFRHRYTLRKNELRRLTGRTCFVCHRDNLKYHPPRDNLGMVASKQDLTYAATYSHKKHIRDSGTGKQCQACHGEFGDDEGSRKGALTAGHPYCGVCHADAAEPTMKRCDGCHKDVNTEAGKNAVAKPRQPTVYAVTGAFSHRSHADIRKVGREGRTCLACHDNITKGKTDADVPLPSMQGCYKSCHDGKQAFSAIGATCTKCHRGGIQ